MKNICEDRMCAGCMACVDACPKTAIAVEPCVDYYRPVIDREKCIDCGMCKRVCQQLEPFEAVEPTDWFQGWDSVESSRGTSSSGGLAAAIARGFVEHGGAVCSCEFSKGSFGFCVEDTVEGLARFKGSKYVKSDPTGAYRRVREVLAGGKSALFIGLPCQVSAIRKSVPAKLAEDLYTVDLICHGSPSPRVLSSFLREQGLELDGLGSIAFRNKGSFQLRDGERFVDTPGVVDAYSVAFLAGLDYTENCYSCPYAKTERVSDITLGDSWGSELGDEVLGGISLVLCQSEKGRRLLDWSGATLKDVDVDRAIENNGQLKAPSAMPASRDRFLALFAEGRPLPSIVRRCLPRAYYRQCLKRTLIKLGLLKRGGGYGLRVAREDVPEPPNATKPDRE